MNNSFEFVGPMMAQAARGGLSDDDEALLITLRACRAAGVRVVFISMGTQLQSSEKFIEAVNKVFGEKYVRGADACKVVVVLALGKSYNVIKGGEEMPSLQVTADNSVAGSSATSAQNSPREQEQEQAARSPRSLALQNKNFYVRHFVPQLEILKDCCDLFVTDHY